MNLTSRLTLTFTATLVIILALTLSLVFFQSSDRVTQGFRTDQD